MSIKSTFRISVYAESGDWVRDSPSFINFNTAEDKDVYVIKEMQFCAADHALFNGAKNKAEREKYRAVLHDRRVMFARKNGYSPSIADRSEWMYRPQRDSVTQQ